MKCTPCSERILGALKHQAKHPQQLADELFITRATIRFHLRTLLERKRVHRKFFHNERTNRPDYLYSSVAFPPRNQKNQADCAKALVVLGLVGDYDALKPVRHV